MPNFETNPEPAAAETMLGKPERDNEREQLEKARQELKDFQEEERRGERHTAHLAEAPGRPDIDLSKLSEEDLRMWQRKEEFTKEELDAYRQRISFEDRDRVEFASFLSNIVTPRLAKEWMEEK